MSILLGGKSDVSLLSPRSSPGVSDEEVVLTVVSSVSNGGDGVIKVGSAVLGVEDSTRVELEVSVGFNRDASWLNVDGSLQLGDTLVLDVSVGGGLNELLGFGGLALSSSSGSVWIVSLELKSVRLGILEGPDFETTIAAGRLLVTVNELLL